MSEPDVAGVSNPFIYGQILLPGYPFCRRPELEKQVQDTADSRRRAVLLGDRRMGKSSLVEHTLGGSDRILLSVDLRGLESVSDFIDRLLLRLATQLETRRPLLKHLPAAFKDALSFVSTLRVNIAGLVEFQASNKVKASTVMQAMDALQRASQWRPLVVFFDEFQEIAENLDAKASNHLLGVLRSEIQRQDRIAYIFAGSARSAMMELFTKGSSHFYQSASIVDVGPIPRQAMGRFFKEQFALGGRDLTEDAQHAIFALAGDSPNDQQQFAYHIWARSTPGSIDLKALQSAFATLMAEVGRRGEQILDDATTIQRRALFAIALREDEEFARDEFLRFGGFRGHSSLAAAIKPFLKGNSALLEKRGSRVRYRERFIRLWLILQLMRNPSMFRGTAKIAKEERYTLLLPYFESSGLSLQRVEDAALEKRDGKNADPMPLRNLQIPQLGIIPAQNFFVNVPMT